MVQATQSSPDSLPLLPHLYLQGPEENHASNMESTSGEKELINLSFAAELQ